MATEDKSSVAHLYGAVQCYSWGVKGRSSLVAAAHSVNCRHTPSPMALPFTVEDDQPYAELWFGTHPSGCASVVPVVPEADATYVPPEKPLPLREYLESGELSGRGECPFLFKLLSIAMPLSLQLHPDEENAQRLHESNPDVYKDPFDKPEMAMALSNPFEAFCGFRRLKEITALAKVVPAFSHFLENALGRIDDPEDEEKCLKLLLANLYSTPAPKIRELIDSILNSQIYLSLTDEPEEEGFFDSAVKTVLGWLGQDQATTNATVRAHHLFKRLHEAYPYDRGCFAPFFLNYVKLKPGECIFLAPNTIHAYIGGNCLECMRCSNNVVRAGLTSKPQDVETLRKLVNYQALSVSHALVKPHEVSCKIVSSGVMSGMVGGKSSLKVFIPPITDAFRFYVLRLATASKAPDVPLPQWYPLMIYVIHGRVKITQVSSVHADHVSSVTSGAGSALVVKEFESIGVDNPSKGWSGDRLPYAGMLTVDSKAMQEGSNTEGDAVVFFVMPNVEPSKVKRSRSGRGGSRVSRKKTDEMSERGVESPPHGDSSKTPSGLGNLTQPQGPVAEDAATPEPAAAVQEPQSSEPQPSPSPQMEQQGDRSVEPDFSEVPMNSGVSEKNPPHSVSEAKQPRILMDTQGHSEETNQVSLTPSQFATNVEQQSADPLVTSEPVSAVVAEDTPKVVKTAAEVDSLRPEVTPETKFVSDKSPEQSSSD
eukprot:Protomagalhaensia_sp_Gyna_25__138@NODE_1066_length_2230_cov_8_198996_g849_i0_p1_GENE_NODE_1066_length_2230_cov_8_198996_g849_i0NODE_1066_length_2230_cov_8_198996_g849_i0_p1_ORF_typecomplete_len709_score131_77PMI_typeI/PF01238_21/5_4e75_NODE_1066_length_2230_cov_8_198996_g849_i0552181